MTNDVAIIGVGLHPFGRFDKTAMQMGAEAIQLALDDAGVQWKDIQFGFGGSYEVSNPDAVTRLVGLTGITFTNVFNACATSGSTRTVRFGGRLERIHYFGRDVISDKRLLHLDVNLVDARKRVIR